MSIALPPAVLTLLFKLARGVHWRGPWFARAAGAPVAAEAAPGLVLPCEACLAEPAEDDRWFGGCGWFDSSHELTRGLLVRELDTPEVLAAALPLSVWLDSPLAG